MRGVACRDYEQLWLCGSNVRPVLLPPSLNCVSKSKRIVAFVLSVILKLVLCFCSTLLFDKMCLYACRYICTLRRSGSPHTNRHSIYVSMTIHVRMYVKCEAIRWRALASACLVLLFVCLRTAFVRVTSSAGFCFCSFVRLLFFFTVVCLTCLCGVRGKKYLQLVLNLELEIYSAAATVAVAAGKRVSSLLPVLLVLTHTCASFW